MPRSEKPEVVLSGAPDDVLNEAAVAVLLGCSDREAAQMFKDKVLAGKKRGNGGWRTTRRVVLAYIEEKESQDG